MASLTHEIGFEALGDGCGVEQVMRAIEKHPCCRLEILIAATSEILETRPPGQAVAEALGVFRAVASYIDRA